MPLDINRTLSALRLEYSPTRTTVSDITFVSSPATVSEQLTWNAVEAVHTIQIQASAP